MKHKAAVKDGHLNITLYKKDIGIWGALVATGDSSTLAVVKQEALAAQASLDQQLEVQRKDRKIDEEKHALRKQMKLDEIERNLVDSLKQEEKETAEKEVYEALAELSRKQVSNSKAISASHSVVEKEHDNIKKKKTSDSSNRIGSIDAYLQSDNIEDVADDAMKEYSAGSSTSQRRDSQFAQEKVAASALEEDDKKYDGDDDDKDDNDYNHSMIPSTSKPSSSSSSLQPSITSVLQHEYDEEVRYIPPPRSTGLSENHSQRKDISFTPRVFPTPMRESKAAEEEDWVAKNRRHLKKHGVLGKGRRKGEQDYTTLDIYKHHL